MQIKSRRCGNRGSSNKAKIHLIKENFEGKGESGTLHIRDMLSKIILLPKRPLSPFLLFSMAKVLQKIFWQDPDYYI